jgi:hypothetical protein
LHDFTFQHEAELFVFLHVVKADQSIARRFRAISSYPRLTVLLAVRAKEAVTSAPCVKVRRRTLGTSPKTVGWTLKGSSHRGA